MSYEGYFILGIYEAIKNTFFPGGILELFSEGCHLCSALGKLRLCVCQLGKN